MIKKIALIVFIVVAGVSLGKAIKAPIAKLTGSEPPSPLSTTLRSTPSISPIAIPPSGMLESDVTVSSTDEASSRLRIYSAPSEEPDGSNFQNKCPESKNKALLKKQHYFLRISDWKSNHMILTAFIRAGEKVNLKLPFGNYKIRYAAGSEWYGEQHLFGEHTRYRQLMDKDTSKQPLKIELSQKQAWNIALFPCGTDGNMTEEPIDPDTF